MVDPAIAHEVPLLYSPDFAGGILDALSVDTFRSGRYELSHKYSPF